MKNEEKDDSKILLRVAELSLLVNTGLVIVKLILSLLTGSLSLRADAVHSLIDIIGSSTLILGLIISRRKSSSFPYGMYKVENFVAIVISFLLFGTAYEIVHQAIFVASALHEFNSLVFVPVAVLILVPFFFGRYEVSTGKRFNSPSLLADGKNFTADVLSSTVVFFGLVGQYLQVPADRIAAVIVAIFIVKAGWDNLVNGMRVLLDASIDPQTLDRIRSTILSDPAVGEVEKVIGRNSGRYVFVEADITLRTSNLERAHQISERIEREIAKTILNVDHTVLHYEPQHATKIRYAVPLANHEGAISDHFGEAPYFAIVDIDIPGRRVERTEVIANPHQHATKKKGILVANFLATFKPDIVASKEDLKGKGPWYVFAGAGTELAESSANDLETFIRQCIGKL